MVRLRLEEWIGSGVRGEGEDRVRVVVRVRVRGMDRVKVERLELGSGFR